MKKKKFDVKRIGSWIAFIFGFGSEIRKETVDIGLCDFSGQGRNQYGK